jgi:23S rRNA pseudouridine2605 synthase
MMRLAKFLASAGIASRRAAENLISAGLVSVNGKVIKEVATNVDPATDAVQVRGKTIQAEKVVYYLLHKPAGYLSAAAGSQGAKLVTQLVPKSPRVYPVGRLDKDSSGLLLLTNDGDLTLQLTHPRYEVQKVYEVELDHMCTPELIRHLTSGITFKEGRAKADKVERITARKLRITLHQGFNRQVRRMLGVCGYTAMKLTRIAEGSLVLGDLQEGVYRTLKREDILQ